MTKLLIFLFCGLLSVTGCTVKPEKPEQDNASASLIASGTTGALTWELGEDGTLTISGKGEMLDYFYNYPYDTHSPPPWHEYSDDITGVIIGNDVSKIGNYAFFRFIKITSVAIGNSVTEIGNTAFQECESLTSIDVPNSVTNIRPYAFSFCTGLTSVTIGNSVNEIGNHAFSGCSDLSQMVSYQEIPPQVTPSSISVERSIPSGTFFGVDTPNCTLLVPSVSVEVYRATVGWKYFGNIKTIQ